MRPVPRARFCPLNQPTDAWENNFRSRPQREGPGRGLFARVECCVMVGFLQRAWFRQSGRPGRTLPRGRRLPHGRRARSHLLLDSRLRGIAGHPPWWASPWASGPDVGPASRRCRKRRARPRSRNIRASVGCQTNTASPLARLLKSVAFASGVAKGENGKNGLCLLPILDRALFLVISVRCVLVAVGQLM